LHKDCSRTIEQDAPIGISKQHTKSKQKIKNSKKIWKYEEQHGLKKNSKRKLQRDTDL